MTCIILFLMNLIPGLSLRVNSEDEELGLDDAQLGEFAYDYVELRRHTDDSIPSAADEIVGESESPIKHSTEKVSTPPPKTEVV